MVQDTLVIDLDGTITIDSKRKGYENKDINDDVKEAILNAKNKGIKICIFTSRNMRTYKGDIDKIHEHTKPVALKWLEENGVEYDNIIFGKPWVGFHGHYIDDKNLHIEEFNFRYGSHFSNFTFDVVISFYNEEGNVLKVHENNKKLERLFNVKNYIYVNNCSSDNTLEELYDIQLEDSKIEVVNVQEDLGYGNGYKNGFKNSTSDYVITNHADNQFDPYCFFMQNLDVLYLQESHINVFPIRMNRSIVSSFFTKILRNCISLLLGKNIMEFNGQPKLLYKDNIQFELEEFPNDYSFDLMLYLATYNSKSIHLPVIEKERVIGESTWSKGIISMFKIFLKYIKTAIIVKNR